MDYLSETAPYEAQIEHLTRLYNTSKKNLQADNERALRDMYVGRMMAERDLPGRLAAYGMHGGLTETSEMDLRNVYGRNRANQEQAYQRNLTDLSNTYQGNVGQLRAQIAAIQARIAAENAKAQAQSGYGYGGGGANAAANAYSAPDWYDQYGQYGVYNQNSMKNALSNKLRLPYAVSSVR